VLEEVFMALKSLIVFEADLGNTVDPSGGI